LIRRYEEETLAHLQEAGTFPNPLTIEAPRKPALSADAASLVLSLED
jgi:hypothetical protein